MNLRINKSRLNQRIKTLSEIGKIPCKGINRLALTKGDKDARDLIVAWMKQLHLKVYIDQIGNIIGLREGTYDLKPIMTGSHIDTVANAGAYDGVYGVLAGLEVIETLNENNIQTNHPIAVTVFTNEEGVRYTPDMLGSLVYTGKLSIEEALKIKGTDGSILGEELIKSGYYGEMNCGTIVPEAFIELHVEQGPILFNENKTIGIVEDIVGINWIELNIVGESNHSGTTPMWTRKDPLYVASLIISFLRDLTKQEEKNLTATCGNIEVKPNLINVIAEKVKLVIDIRSRYEKEIKSAKDKILNYVEILAKQERVIISSIDLVKVAPVRMNKKLVNIINQNANNLNYSFRKITSGAGHDAQIMAGFCPSAMIFVPSNHGISHNFREFTKLEHLEAGVNLLLNTIIELSLN